MLNLYFIRITNPQEDGSVVKRLFPRPFEGRIAAGYVARRLKELGMDDPFGEKTTYSPLGLFRYDGAEGEQCPECRVKVGAYHEAGCDWEKCPICLGYLAACECLLK